jgi:hypothetical protein
VTTGTGTVTSQGICDPGDTAITGSSQIITISGPPPTQTFFGSSSDTQWTTQATGSGTYTVHAIAKCFDNS